MSRSNTTELVGSVVLVEQDHADRFLPDLLWEIRLRSDSPVTSAFLTDFLQSTAGRRLLQAAAMGTSGSMKKLSMGRIRAIEVPVVNRDEQKAWVGVSRSIRAALTSIDRLLDAKRAFRRALLHDLLTGRRFPEFTTDHPWRYTKINDIATERSVRAGGLDGTVLSCTKHQGLVASLSYFGKQVFSRDISNYKVIRRGEFAYATNHIEEGSLGLLREHDAGVVSPMYTVFAVERERMLPEFLYLVLKTEQYRRVFERLTIGSVDRRGALRWSNFKTIGVPLPSIAEQHRIAETLNSADREIRSLEKLRDAYAVQKHALLDRILSGSIVLPTPENAHA